MVVVEIVHPVREQMMEGGRSKSAAEPGCSSALNSGAWGKRINQVCSVRGLGAAIRWTHLVLWEVEEAAESQPEEEIHVNPGCHNDFLAGCHRLRDY